MSSPESPLKPRLNLPPSVRTQVESSGLAPAETSGSRPEATCQLYGQRAILHLDLGLVFPTPLSSTIEDLRAHVSGRVEKLCGVRVAKMSIDISWLNPSNHVRRSLR